MKKKYAILRIQKRSSMRAVTLSHKHNSRIGKQTVNVNPSGPKPRLLAGVEDLPQAISLSLPQKRRKDAVIAMEFLLTASPEWFAEATPAVIEEWVEENTAWIQQELGSNFVQAIHHGDELTIHIHAYGTCLVNNRLCFKQLYGTPQSMVRLQDRYAKAMKRFGLKRGNPKSKASHNDISAMAKRLKRLESASQVVADALQELSGHIHTLAGLERLNGLLLAVKDALRPDSEGGEPAGNSQSTTVEKASDRCSNGDRPKF